MKKRNFKKISNFTLLTTLTLGTIIVPGVVNGSEKVDLNSEETIQITNSKTTTFDLNDWTHQDNGTEIVLSAYNGSATKVLIPGEVNGKRVVLTNLSFLPNNLQSLTIQEVNGQKVGLETDSLAYALSSYHSLTFVDLRGLDTSGITSMQSMFESSSVSVAELAGLDVSNVQDMSYMFNNAGSSPRIYDFTGWKLNPTVNTTDMFYHDNYTLGLIVATDPTLKTYDYAAGNLHGFGPWFYGGANVNGEWVNGQFADGSSSYQPVKFQVLDSREKDYIQELINDVYNNAPEPSATGYKFLGYGTGPYTLKDDSLEEVYYSIECSYIPEWEKMPDNQVPTITATDITIHAGFEFNPLDYVSAEDPEEGELVLTEANVISNTVNPDVAGIYEVTYEVADKEGEVATKTIQVTVNALPVINAQDLVILQVGDTFEPLDYVSVTDEEDGDFKREDIKVTENDVDTSKPGDYYVTYEVEDSNGAVVSYMIMVVVEELPVDDEIIDQPTDEEPNQKPNEDVETPDQPNDEGEEVEKPTTNNNTETEEKDPSDGKEDIEAGASSGLLVLIGGLSLFQGFNLFIKRQKKN